MDRGERARSLGLELLVIVVGVLLALGAQAAVEEWSDRARADDFLVDLLSEFRVNEARLQQDLEMTLQAVTAAELWRSATAGATDLDRDSIASLYAASLNPARFDPISGSLRSLIDGGDLGLIRNRQLRAELAGWGDRTQEQLMTSFSVDMMRSMLTHFLISEGQALPAQALELDRLMLQVIGDQQAALLEPLREIIALLGEELGE